MTSPVLIVLFVVVAFAGLMVGSFLTSVIHRVPARIPLTTKSRCPHCGLALTPSRQIPVVSWVRLRGACAGCGGPISKRYPLVELFTGAAFVAVSWWVWESDTFVQALPSPRPSIETSALWPILVAYLYLAAIGIALTVIDIDTHRLPNAIVLPASVVLAVLFTFACLRGAPWEALVRAAVGAVVLFVFYALLRAVRPGAMGGGDVKLAGVLGAALAFAGWGSLIVGAFAAFLFGGFFGIVLMLTGRANSKSAIPFGPWMIAGAWVGLFAGETLMGGYAGLLGTG